MVIRPKAENLSFPELYLIRLRRNARRTIAFYRMGAIEKALDAMLKKQQGMGLKEICMLMTKRADYMTDLHGHAIVCITEPTLDKLARLITYGDGVRQGSQILKRAFCACDSRR